MTRSSGRAFPPPFSPDPYLPPLSRPLPHLRLRSPFTLATQAILKTLEIHNQNC